MVKRQSSKVILWRQVWSTGFHLYKFIWKIFFNNILLIINVIYSDNAADYIKF